MDSTFIQGRIDATKAQIVAYETAIDDLIAGNIQSYTLDTGQSRQVVTKMNIATLQSNLDALYNRLCTLEARLNGGNTIAARPEW